MILLVDLDPHGKVRDPGIHSPDLRVRPMTSTFPHGKVSDPDIHLAPYIAQGGIRCGFISLVVCRYKSYVLHSYAFIEVLADVDDMKRLYNLI
jgi:hypothetical protein